MLERLRTSVALPALVVLIALGAPLTHATPNDPPESEVVRTLRGEIERLRAEVARQAEEIRLLRETIAQLQARGSGAEGRPTRPPTPIPQTEVDERRPFDSPAALEREARRLYEEQLANRPLGEPNTPARAAYLRSVDEWRRAAARDLSATVEWHGIIREWEEQRGQLRLLVQIVDPESGTPIGTPIEASGGRALARTFTTMRERGGLDQPLVLRGIVRTILAINPDRAVPGPFNVPPLIGPFVEMDLMIGLQSLARPRPRPGTPPAEEARGQQPDS